MTDTAALFVEHKGPLFRYLCRAIGQVEAARDLTQDVFVRVARAPVPEVGPGETRAWLFTIARNLALDYHRRERLRREVDSPPAESAQPSQDTGFAVREALAALSDLDRDIFLMKEVGGLSYDEVATACEVTPAAVRSRIHRTRLVLRERLSEPLRARHRRLVERSTAPSKASLS